MTDLLLEIKLVVVDLRNALSTMAVPFNLIDPIEALEGINPENPNETVLTVKDVIAKLEVGIKYADSIWYHKIADRVFSNVSMLNYGLYRNTL